MSKDNAKKGFISTLLLLSALAFGAQNALAQASPSVLYVPLIGLTSVPDPLALPNGEGNVTYHYAVKNFLGEIGLTNIQVTDDKCTPVKFTEGDDNSNSKLDYTETWRYTCTVKLSKTTQNTATASGTANNITARHSAYATVVVGSKNPPPLVSIVNITKVASPLSLPSGGGSITFTYRVNNPGVVPLANVTVSDNKCSAMSGKLGDTNGNNLLDTNEVWMYTCTANLEQTTTNLARVTAFANGLKAVGETSITVNVDSSTAQSAPNFPNAGPAPEMKPNVKMAVWTVLSGLLIALIVFFAVTRKKVKRNMPKQRKPKRPAKKR